MSVGTYIFDVVCQHRLSHVHYRRIKGKRYLHLTGDDNSWRISQEIHSPWPTTINIIAK
jgi:hypothetical protein